MYWVTPNDPDAYVVLSTNTAESIRAAKDWWTVTGTVSVVILGIVCALCWWHQRRLRKIFRDEADNLDEDREALQLQLKKSSSVSPSWLPTSPVGP